MKRGTSGPALALGGLFLVAVVASAGLVVDPDVSIDGYQFRDRYYQAHRGEVLVGCGKHFYPREALAGPTGAELADDGAARALRRMIEDEKLFEQTSANGWRRLYDDGHIVVFGAGDPPEPGLVSPSTR